MHHTQSPTTTLPLGRVLATPGALEALADRDIPESALECTAGGEQVVSLYPPGGTKLSILIVTEPDTSATKVLVDWEDFDAL